MKFRYKILIRLIILFFIYGCNSYKPTLYAKKDCRSQFNIKLSKNKQLAQNYLLLGKCQYENFEFNFAVDSLEKSISLYNQFFDKTQFKDNIGTRLSHSYYYLGKVNFDLKKYNIALEKFKTSLKYYKAINRGKTDKELAKIYNALAQTYLKLKNKNKALMHFRLAEGYSNSSDEDTPTALTLKLRAKVSSLDNNITYKNKLKLKNFINKWGNHSIKVANLYQWMAKEYESKRELNSAFNYYKKSVNIYKEKPFLLYHPYLYKTLFNLSKVSKQLGKNREYSNSSIQAFGSYYRNREKVFSTFSQNEKLEFSKKRKKYLYNLFDSLSLYNNNDAIRKSLNLWINYKRSIFDFENSLYILSKKDNNLKSKYEEWNKKRRELAHLEQQNTTYNIKNISKKISNLEKEMSYIFSKYHKKINYKEISKYLKLNELYIDFVKSGNNYYYFTLDKNQNITFKKINKEQTKKIELAIKTIQQDNDESSRDLKVAQKAYGKLYKLIIEPLNVEMKNKNALIISPDGMLDLVPFEAFFNQKEKRYLIQDYCIRYIPSGKEFVKLSEDSSLPNQNIVIFANSDFKSIRKNRNRGGIFDGLKEFDNLTYALDEANSVKKYFPNSQYFLDENATEENFMKVSKPKIWHIVTHGFLSKNKNSLNPLLNCGIVLYGANESIRNKKGDGIITGLELAGMDLKGTELVVLSACLTGVGEVDNSEGVASISKAFRKAGAKYLLTTLWSIDDELTVTLMKKFYKYIKEGNMSYGKALQRAKIDLIMDISNYHPYYWAGFVGSGRD